MNEIVPVAMVEIPPSPQTEAAASEAAVEIAAIQADRDIEIAQINADTTEIIVEAAAESDAEDVEWLRAELDGLREQSAMLAGRLSDLETLVTAQGEALATATETMAIQAALLATLTPSEAPPEEAPSTPPEPSGNPPPPPPDAGTGNGTGAKVRARRWM